MTMVDLDDDKGIEKEMEKERKNKRHEWCKKCGRPKKCNDPDCTHIHHCNCNEL
jgi:hypothetical protein